MSVIHSLALTVEEAPGLAPPTSGLRGEKRLGLAEPEPDKRAGDIPEAPLPDRERLMSDSTARSARDKSVRTIDVVELRSFSLMSVFALHELERSSSSVSSGRSSGLRDELPGLSSMMAGGSWGRSDGAGGRPCGTSLVARLLGLFRLEGDNSPSSRELRGDLGDLGDLFPPELRENEDPWERDLLVRLKERMRFMRLSERVRWSWPHARWMTSSVCTLSPYRKRAEWPRAYACTSVAA
mmetsp:Transcript_86571/g.172793  ORF Transcript_86571/g.172793 Transcript_86571/m.172793 type:complete len:239 (-) Transcript_86571:1197-1913(-)